MKASLGQPIEPTAVAAGGSAYRPRIFGIGAEPVQIPAHRGQSFRRIADSVPVIADSF